VILLLCPAGQGGGGPAARSAPRGRPGSALHDHRPRSRVLVNQPR
jgi:hypothetical protein